VCRDLPAAKLLLLVDFISLDFLRASFLVGFGVRSGDLWVLTSKF
jgi:hypothetical protein